MAAGEAVVEAMEAADMAWVEVEGLPLLGRACTTTCHNLMPAKVHLGVVEVLAREARRMLSTHHQRTPQLGPRMPESLAQTTVEEVVAETEASIPMPDETSSQQHLMAHSWNC
jgi:hypothetical protein